MLPGHLIAQFWHDIQEMLENQYRVSEQEALGGIAEYRTWLDSHQVGDIIYHMNPSEIAEAIASGVRYAREKKPVPVSAQEKACG
jgi:hypothetical protein